MNGKMIFLEKAQSHHKGEGSGSPGESGRFRVEKQCLSKVQLLKPFVSRKEVSGISGNVENIRQGDLTIPKVGGKTFFRQEGFTFGRGNDLSLNQLLNGHDRLLRIGLFRFEKSVQPLPQVAPSHALPREGGGVGGGGFRDGGETVQAFFEIHCP